MSDPPEGANINKLNEIKWIHWQITFSKRTEKRQRLIKNSENLIHAWNLQFILFASQYTHQRRKNMQQSPFLSCDGWDKNSGFSLKVESNHKIEFLGFLKVLMKWNFGPLFYPNNVEVFVPLISNFRIWALNKRATNISIASRHANYIEGMIV